MAVQGERIPGGFILITGIRHSQRLHGLPGLEERDFKAS
jgi:hypothetical protein